MATITPETTVGQLVAEDARRSRIFDQLGIDYCCGRRRSLADACQKKGLDPDTVVRMLDAAAAAPAETGTDWSEASLSDLADHIEATHHAYLREELPRLSGLLSKVARVHGKAAPWIVEVKEVFDTLRPKLEAHLVKEEEVVFPLIRALEQGAPFPDAPTLGEDPIHLMEEEHDEVGEALAQMRALSNDYTPPEGACGSFRAVLSGLAELEKDMHQHVHKENNILFARARVLA